MMRLHRVFSRRSAPGMRRPVDSRAGGLCLLALTLPGCHSYSPRPLDLQSAQQSFLTRTADSPAVMAFAERLRGSQGATDWAFDPANGIDAREAAALAMVFNPDLRVARLKAGVTEAGAKNAGLWEDPTIGVDLTRIIEGTPHPWKVFSSIGLTIPISGRLDVEKKRAGFEHAAELARVAQREWETRIELRRAWVRWSAFDAQITSTREFLSRAEQVLSVVDAMERAGEMTRSEARLFRIERATAQAALSALEARAASAILEIKRIAGLSPTAPIRLIADGIGTFEYFGTPRERESATHELIRSRNPSLQVAVAEYEVAERALELESRKQYPDLNIGPGYGREDGEDQLLLGLSLPIPILNGNRRGIAEAEAAREVARANAEAVFQRLLSEIADAEVVHESAGKQRLLLENEIGPLVDEQYTEARRVAQLGEVNALVLLESLTRQQDAKARLVEAFREEALARLRIDELIGPEASAMMPADGPVSAPHESEGGVSP